MREKNGKSILRSAERLVEAEKGYRETGNPAWIWYLKKESSLLLRRVFRLWMKLRFGREEKGNE